MFYSKTLGSACRGQLSQAVQYQQATCIAGRFIEKKILRGFFKMHFDHIYLLTYLFPDPSPIPYPPTPLFVCFFKSVRTNLYCPNSLGCLESGHWRVDFFTGGYAVKENRVSLFFSQQWTNSCTDDPEWFITKSVLGAGSSLPFPQQPLLPLFWSTF